MTLPRHSGFQEDPLGRQRAPFHASMKISSCYGDPPPCRCKGALRPGQSARGPHRGLRERTNPDVTLSLHLRRNWRAPLNWPPPPRGFSPPAGWQPDPSWPAPPPDWRFWRLPRGRIAGAVLLLLLSGLFSWGLVWRVGVYHRHQTLNRVGVTTAAQVLEVSLSPEGDPVDSRDLKVRFTTATGRVVTVSIQHRGAEPMPGDTTGVTYEPAHPTNARWADFPAIYPDPDADPATVRDVATLAAVVTFLAAGMSVPLLFTRRPAVAATHQGLAPPT
jgi:hypothetical protein